MNSKDSKTSIKVCFQAFLNPVLHTNNWMWSWFILTFLLSRCHLLINSSHCLLYNSCDISLENLVLNQLMIPFLIFFFILIFLVCLILYWYCKENFCLSHSWELKSYFYNLSILRSADLIHQVIDSTSRGIPNKFPEIYSHFMSTWSLKGKIKLSWDMYEIHFNQMLKNTSKTNIEQITK